MLVASVYRAAGDFKYLIFVGAVLARVMMASAICLPAQVEKRTAGQPRGQSGSRNF
jgi:hypothetical protein